MKRFVSIFAGVLLFLFAFCFCGGIVFFDINRHVYAWMVASALLASLVIWALLHLSDRIDALQKRVDALEAAQKNTDCAE